MSTILPKPSVSPLPSFCSVPTVTHRAVSFSAALRMVVRWACHCQPETSERDKQLERVLIARLAEEMEADAGPDGGLQVSADPSPELPPAKRKEGLEKIPPTVQAKL